MKENNLHVNETNKKKVMISFQEGKENGGPYTSHKRIKDSKLKEQYEFVPYIIPNGRVGLINFKLLCNLMKQIKDENPDLVHIHGLQLVGFYYALAAYLSKKPIVLAVRGSVKEAINFSSWKKWIINILEILTLRMSDVVYGVSDYVCSWEIVKKHAGKRLYGTVYNMMQIEDTIGEGTRERVREELGISSEDIVVVSTGRITEEKGFKILCEAILKLKQMVSLKFIIVGEGSYLEEFKQVVTREQLANRVFFTGYQKNVDSFLKAADIFVICSLHETLCNSLIEAGAMGLPLIAPEVGGIPEIVKSDITGILLKDNTPKNVANAIETLSVNSLLREKYGNQARKHTIDKFGQDIIIEQIRETYEKCVGGK